MSGKRYVGPNVPNANGQDLPAIFHTLTDGVNPESGREALGRMQQTSFELQDALQALGNKLDELADIWQAPSTQRGADAIREVKGHVDLLKDHAGVVGTAFGHYIDDVDTARSQVPRPQWWDEMVKSPTPAQALWLGPVLPLLEHDLQQRTSEARQHMQNLTYSAQAVDAATAGFEPLPSQVVQPPANPKGPSGGGGSVVPRPTPGGPQPDPTTTTATPAPALQPPSTPQTGRTMSGIDPARFASPVQITTESHVGPEVTIAPPASVDSPRFPAPGGSAGVGGLPLPGGQTGNLSGGRGGGNTGSLGRGGQPGGGNAGGGAGGRGGGGLPRTGGLSARDGAAGRGAGGRAGGLGGGGSHGAGTGEGDEDYEHQRAAFLYADETADELFGTDELTPPPVIGGPDN